MTLQPIQPPPPSTVRSARYRRQHRLHQQQQQPLETTSSALPTPQKIIYPPKEATKINQSPINRTVSTTSSITTAPSITCSGSTEEANETIMMNNRNPNFDNNNDAAEVDLSRVSLAQEQQHPRQFHELEMAYHHDYDPPLQPMVDTPPNHQQMMQTPPLPSALRSSTVLPQTSSSSRHRFYQHQQTPQDNMYASTAPPPPATPMVVSPDNVSAYATMDDCFSETSHSTFPPPPPPPPGDVEQQQHPSNYNTVPTLSHNNRSNNNKRRMKFAQKKDDDWRRHGRAYRNKLIQHDEATGLHDFELSNDCSIQRYHSVAEKVLGQFMETREDPHVDLRDTYLVGTRLSKFLSTVLPMHKDFNSPDPELSEMRRQSHAQWLTLTHYLEELALILDEEEHNQFVLRDLNDTEDSEEEEDEKPMDVPPELVLNVPAPSIKKQQAKGHAGRGDSDNGQSSTQQQHQHSNTFNQPSSNYNSIMDRGDDPWRTVDATTVASLDTHWFSSAFSEPFPPSTGEDESHNDERTAKKAGHALLDEDERILGISGSERTKNPNTSIDTADIPFENLSLEEEARNLDIRAQQMTNGAAPQQAKTVTPTSNNEMKNERNRNSNNMAWRIAPSLSTKSPHNPSPLSNDSSAYKEEWGCSPFHDPTNTTSSNSKPEFSWIEPSSSVKYVSPVMDMSPLCWEETSEPLPTAAAQKRSSKVAQKTSTRQSNKTVEEEVQHSKLNKASKRPFSRYMALDEHKKNRQERQNRQHQQHTATKHGNDRKMERRPLRDQDSEDADFERIGALLDGNKASARREYNGSPALRQRGMHHMKECVRCLLE